ncbi:MAG: phosphoenolpyruvate synthase [Clostridiales bacterium]|nr:phosphoenolpyruvate synthase [Clostridiales bacterium]
MYGRKIENLKSLSRAGFNVPPFSVIENRDDEIRLPSDAALFSVRSACNIEDSASSSFAGQFDTFLNVSAADVPKKVEQVFDSADSESIAAYASSMNIPASDIKMNVIVQEMVGADISGVIFTANPQGILNETVIVAGRGAGQGVVTTDSDSVTYYWNRTDKVFFYEGSEDILKEDLALKIAELSESVTGELGDLLDIEFAVKDGEIFILQARDITTLNADDPVVLDNSNIVESYPGLSLPLTISFVDMVYSGVFRGLAYRVLKNRKELAKREDVISNMTGHANGRIYYKISNWYTVIKFLPFSKKIIPLWQEMLGVKTKTYDDGDLKLNPFVRIGTYFNSFAELTSAPRKMRRLNTSFTEVNEDFYKNFREDLTPAELIKMFGGVKEKLLKNWDVTLLNDMYAFIYTGLLKSRLKKKYHLDEGRINSLISGITDIESMKPVKALIKLASEDGSEEKKREYIKLYGDRNLEELKLESRTFRSSPELLDKRIEELKEDPARLAAVQERFAKEHKEDMPRDLLTDICLKRCCKGIANREISRLNRSRIYGIVRLIIDTMAKQYKMSGYIANEEDIYMLSLDEVFALAEEAKDMKEIVDERKARYDAFKVLPAYSRLIFADKEFDRTVISIGTFGREKSSDVLQGVPCSAGIAEAEALVIKDVKDAKDVKGKILVAKMTDPGWVFLLASASGIISEKGSLLSHTAIISRELGIPAVVGVNEATDLIRSGDIIRIDGTTGKIEKVRR